MMTCFAQHDPAMLNTLDVAPSLTILNTHAKKILNFMRTVTHNLNRTILSLALRFIRDFITFNFFTSSTGIH